MVNNTPNKTIKFTAKKWNEIGNESRGKYDEAKPIRFKTSMLTSSLCNYIVVYILRNSPFIYFLGCGGGG